AYAEDRHEAASRVEHPAAHGGALAGPSEEPGHVGRLAPLVRAGSRHGSRRVGPRPLAAATPLGEEVVEPGPIERHAAGSRAPERLRLAGLPPGGEASRPEAGRD